MLPLLIYSITAKDKELTQQCKINTSVLHLENEVSVLTHSKIFKYIKTRMFFGENY